ncbi:MULTISPECIES: hypothetical protein [Liquorilactobacillus]|jgi:hypothetical protein|uniref:Uncharacterized protein n=1 Tax=Liquorilactobacillus hordei TaxID=468911 RepID=A0A3Q8CSV1_9LACO|nr:hypothetical protein [Liquorilactobacillus hordei]AUJ29795.1 hypothetical protein BSQ49_06075 [Liquorilactobacillus hordei]
MIFLTQKEAIRTYLIWVDKQLDKEKNIKYMPLVKVGEFRDHEVSSFEIAFMTMTDELRTHKKYKDLHYDKLPKNYAVQIIQDRKRNFRERLLNELLMIF